MQIIDYYSCSRPEYWLEQIRIGFVYTFPAYRGHRYMGELFLEIEKRAKAQNVHDIFISTNHTGLYEKYGCEFYQIINDMKGEPSRVYKKHVD